MDYQADVLITFERLFEDAGLDTTTTWSGLNALQLTKASSFDLVLVNEHLSDMPAPEFVRQIAAIGIPCMIMQGFQPEREARSSLLGVAGVVSKMSPVEIMRIVSAKLGLAKTCGSARTCDTTEVGYR